jgi:polyisoprenoid-binding protein YceI
MKTKLILSGALIASFALFGFTAPKAGSKAESYKVDAAKSTMVWTGKKVTGAHTGGVKLASGSLSLNGDAVQSGNFVIDMTSLTNTDMQGEYSDKLLGHLKSDDFFSVDKFPTSNFEITKISNAGKDRVNVEGNLTIKGITNPVTFPASISKKNNVVVAVATIKVDRTKYDIKYGSKSFFEGIGDKAIDNDFELQVNLVAIK